MRMEKHMSERAKQLASDLARWGHEALQEWGEGVREYPIPSLFTFLFGAFVATVLGWIL